MSPAIPEGFYRELGRQIEQRSGFPVEVWFESCRSGPSLTELESGKDPFQAGRAELAVLCAPTYIRARRRGVAELLGYTPLFQDSRCRGRAVYFSDIMVSEKSSFTDFEELRGGSWAFNDTESLSGYFSMLGFLQERGEGQDFFRKAVCSGGHRFSLRLLEEGVVDCAAIDANLLLFLRQEGAMPAVRKVGEIGPSPAPPLAVSSALAKEDKARLKNALTRLREDTSAMAMLRDRFLLEDLVPVDEEHYRPVAELLSALGHPLEKIS